MQTSCEKSAFSMRALSNCTLLTRNIREHGFNKNPKQKVNSKVFETSVPTSSAKEFPQAQYLSREQWPISPPGQMQPMPNEQGPLLPQGPSLISPQEQRDELRQLNGIPYRNTSVLPEVLEIAATGALVIGAAALYARFGPIRAAVKSEGTILKAESAAAETVSPLRNTEYFNLSKLKSLYTDQVAPRAREFFQPAGQNSFWNREAMRRMVESFTKANPK